MKHPTDLVRSSAARSRRTTLVSRDRATGMAALVVAVLLLVGCGGSDVASEDGSDQVAEGSSDTQAFRDCLAEQGVELPAGGERPQGGGPGSGTPDGSTPPDGGAAQGGGRGGFPGGEGFAEAQEACAEFAPEGGGGFPGGGGRMNSEEIEAYTECLTENGVELEQPGASADGQPPTDGGAGARPGGGRGGFNNLDESDPGVAACADLRPEMPTPPGEQGQQGNGSDESPTSTSTTSAPTS